MKYKFILSIALAGLAFQVGAQDAGALWQQSKQPVASQGEQVLRPSKFAAYYIQEGSLSSMLNAVGEAPESATIIDLPAPDGTFRAFRIWKTPMMAKQLATRYAQMETFTAEAVNNRMVTAKIDYTQYGFHALVFDGSKSFFIDPYSNIADGNYMSYYKNDYPLPAGKTMYCGVNEDGMAVPGSEGLPMTLGGDFPNAERVNGTTRRKYRTAISCTGEYAVAVDGVTPTKAGVLARILTSLNRVNGVFERELAVTLELIANNDTLINLVGATDPYTNGSGNAMLSENQVTVNARVGSANYDLGHVFSTGGGGIATLGAICGNSKAQGVTGQANPIGDRFDIDFVAHEMGHQLGASHTFNNNISGSCSGNAASSQAYEPGSGSTIMAYAGICGGGNDYQSRSDDYFHSASLEQIVIRLGNTTCATTSTSSNQNATMPSFGGIYYIPYLTPFELTAPVASDATADEPITYAWEQRDRGDFGKSLADTRLAGPLFRPFRGTTSTTRIFPQIDSLLRNRFSYNAEKLPDTTRKMAFRVVQRDMFQGFGCWNFPTDSFRLEVIHTGTPFKVTSPGTGSTWTAGSNATVTWDVGGSSSAPINCANVDIFLSTDGGYTFPYTLASGTSNDGSESITVPNVNSTRMRIKVKGSGNVFLSISAANATVTGGVGVAAVNTQPIVTVSPVPASETITITVNDAFTYQARITNAVGQVAWLGAVNAKAILGVAPWAKGVYYLQLRNTATGVHVSKQLIIQ